MVVVVVLLLIAVLLVLILSERAGPTPFCDARRNPSSKEELSATGTPSQFPLAKHFAFAPSGRLLT